MGVCVLRVLRGETVFVFLDRRRRENQHAVRVSSLVFMIPVNQLTGRIRSPRSPRRNLAGVSRPGCYALRIVSICRRTSGTRCCTTSHTSS